MSIGDVIKQKNFPNAYVKLEVNILYTAGWIQNHNNKFFKQYDISMQQYNVLRILRGQFPNACMLNVISDRMIDKMSNATRLVEKLRKKGLVTRRLNPNNRRQVDILITEQGLDLLKQIDDNFSQHEAVFKELSQEEAFLLSDLLDKLRGSDDI
ncbi:MAG: MarR family transcriptional regulator [Chitinophagales bacterium]|nr:MarR family transcriptional regulator [Chitinophagales bacterium]MCZ2392719.1 MarR family transcriptional regulator [Chitinophagales bacterium]